MHHHHNSFVCVSHFLSTIRVLCYVRIFLVFSNYPLIVSIWFAFETNCTAHREEPIFVNIFHFSLKRSEHSATMGSLMRVIELTRLPLTVVGSTALTSSYTGHRSHSYPNYILTPTDLNVWCNLHKRSLLTSFVT